MTANNFGRRYIDKREAAAYFGVSERTVSRWIADGTLPTRKIGKRLVRIDIADLEALPAA